MDWSLSQESGPQSTSAMCVAGSPSLGPSLPPRGCIRRKLESEAKAGIEPDTQIGYVSILTGILITRPNARPKNAHRLLPFSF